MNRCFFELILAIKQKCECNEGQIRKQLGLSQAEFNGLLALERDREIQGCQLAQRMGVSASRGSRILNQLAVAGYVKTRIDPEDRRTILISMTSQGQQMRERIMGCASACEDRVRERIDRVKIGQIKESLRLLEGAL